MAKIEIEEAELVAMRKDWMLHNALRTTMEYASETMDVFDLMRVEAIAAEIKRNPAGREALRKLVEQLYTPDFLAITRDISLAQ